MRRHLNTGNNRRREGQLVARNRRSLGERPASGRLVADRLRDHLDQQAVSWSGDRSLAAEELPSVGLACLVVGGSPIAGGSNVMRASQVISSAGLS